MTERVEITIPGATTKDLAAWADPLQSLNPITNGFPPFRPAVGWVITDQPFMGIEITCMAGKTVVAVLTLFADVPTEEEKEIMRRNDTRWAQH